MESSKRMVMEAFGKAEKRLKPNIGLMFGDVYDEMTPQLRKQFDELKQHVELHSDQYPVKNFDGMSIDK